MRTDMTQGLWPQPDAPAGFQSVHREKGARSHVRATVCGEPFGPGAMRPSARSGERFIPAAEKVDSPGRFPNRRRYDSVRAEAIRTGACGMGKPIEVTRLEMSATELREMAAKTRDGAVVRRLLGI